MSETDNYKLILCDTYIPILVKEWSRCTINNKEGYVLPFDKKEDILIFVGLDRVMHLIFTKNDNNRTRIPSKRRIRSIIKFFVKNGVAVIEPHYENPFPEFPDVMEYVIPFEE